jgi:D-Tyr-tRNAtyr deacylase
LRLRIRFADNLRDRDINGAIFVVFQYTVEKENTGIKSSWAREEDPRRGQQVAAVAALLLLVLLRRR